jgi:mRNA interferase MazF
VTFEPFDVVVVPFPFTDCAASRKRPALVLSQRESFNAPAGHAVMAMVTSAKHRRWPLDVPISELARAGLPSPSVVRMKLFTLDSRLVLRSIGRLGAVDAEAVRKSLTELLPLAGSSTGKSKSTPATAPQGRTRGR